MPRPQSFPGCSPRRGARVTVWRMGAQARAIPPRSRGSAPPPEGGGHSPRTRRAVRSHGRTSRNPRARWTFAGGSGPCLRRGVRDLVVVSRWGPGCGVPRTTAWVAFAPIVLLAAASAVAYGLAAVLQHGAQRSNPRTRGCGWASSPAWPASRSGCWAMHWTGSGTSFNSWLFDEVRSRSSNHFSS